MGLQIILQGPSGSGKTTVQTLLEREGYHRGITCTTRKPGPGEVRGVTYDYLNRWRYIVMAFIGQIPERTVYVGNRTWYGILRHRVEAAIKADRPTIWVMDSNGIEWWRRRVGAENVIGILLYAPKDELRWRLIYRGRETPRQIEKRLDSHHLECAEGCQHANHGCIVDTTGLAPEEVAATVRQLIER